jgi:hypothetical protein
VLPARRVFIPQPGRPDAHRPLSIPAVRDRIVQAAVKMVIEPIFEAWRRRALAAVRGAVVHDHEYALRAAVGIDTTGIGRLGHSQSFEHCLDEGRCIGTTALE